MSEIKLPSKLEYKEQVMQWCNNLFKYLMENEDIIITNASFNKEWISGSVLDKVHKANIEIIWEGDLNL